MFVCIKTNSRVFMLSLSNKQSFYYIFLYIFALKEFDAYLINIVLYTVKSIWNPWNVIYFISPDNFLPILCSELAAMMMMMITESRQTQVLLHYYINENNAFLNVCSNPLIHVAYSPITTFTSLSSSVQYRYSYPIWDVI